MAYVGGLYSKLALLFFYENTITKYLSSLGRYYVELG